MSNSRQQSLKEAFGARKSATVENDNPSSDSELSDSDIADPNPPDIEVDDTPEATECETAGQPSGASGSSTTMPSVEEMEIQLLDKPHQPRSGVFPKRQFGQKKPEYRSFKPIWFDNKLWSNWLHWESKNNRAYCFICRNVYVLHQLTLSKNQESAFITSGFNNWKDATRAFELHRKSSCHREAILKWEHHERGISVDLQLQRRLAAEQVEARNCLRKIFTSIEYLARQALPLRGHQEERGNFYQLMKLRGADSDGLKRWLQQRRSYTSHEVQNEILKVMAHQIQRSILKDIYTSMWFCVSADETVDISLIEQVHDYLYKSNYHCGSIHYSLSTAHSMH
jgi:hypothetical protein